METPIRWWVRLVSCVVGLVWAFLGLFVPAAGFRPDPVVYALLGVLSIVGLLLCHAERRRQR